ncbi:Alpha/Beta hydrolase protein [Gaertneriomyces semiglobifer]|nr:Alpha/Beta hydrolase protein [Gaertneriomyces semiglobifer]
MDSLHPEHTQWQYPDSLIVGGIRVYIFGLSALRQLTSENKQPKVAVCFFAHGRLGSAEQHFPFCSHLCTHLNESHSERLGLVVTFDQRNHGQRLLSSLANEAWKSGNDTHGYDMYSIQYGTAKDISYLMDVLPMFLGAHVDAWGVCGISLGGHAALLCTANDPRINATASMIGCGDYMALMRYRAEKSNIPLPPSSNKFINEQLVALVQKHDPVNLAESFRGRPTILLGGGADRLVPPDCNAAFVDRLKQVYAENANELLQIVIEDGVRHEATPSMKEHTMKFMSKWLMNGDATHTVSVDSKAKI